MQSLSHTATGNFVSLCDKSKNRNLLLKYSKETYMVFLEPLYNIITNYIDPFTTHCQYL